MFIRRRLLPLAVIAVWSVTVLRSVHMHQTTLVELWMISQALCLMSTWAAIICLDNDVNHEGGQIGIFVGPAAFGYATLMVMAYQPQHVIKLTIVSLVSVWFIKWVWFGVRPSKTYKLLTRLGEWLNRRRIERKRKLRHTDGLETIMMDQTQQYNVEREFDPVS